MTANHSQFDHEQYEELCVLATAGALTSAESEALFAHLDECSECSKLFAQYESLANEGMAMLNELHRSSHPVPRFDEASALDRLLEKTHEIKPGATKSQSSLLRFIPSTVWQGLAAALALACIALGAYRLGEHRRGGTTGDNAVVLNQSHSEKDVRTLEAKLKTSQAREAQLESALFAKGEDVDKLAVSVKVAQERLDILTASLATSKTDAASQVANLTEQRDSANAKLHDAEQVFQNVQEELANLHSLRKQDLVQIASLQGQVGSLTVAVKDQDKRANDDEQYLASDKDIRDLIGARNLYIADIMDVNETGQSRRPFGRVFYTKTKSLIFYAYDLDRQPGVKQTSTFHVWGRTGAKDRQPINLGLLYLDSETNRRWTLRVNDPEQLAKLDAVFVTIEPGKQIEKPSGKPFLYASLRREPNHP